MSGGTLQYNLCITFADDLVHGGDLIVRTAIDTEHAWQNLTTSSTEAGVPGQLLRQAVVVSAATGSSVSIHYFKSL